MKNILCLSFLVFVLFSLGFELKKALSSSKVSSSIKWYDVNGNVDSILTNNCQVFTIYYDGCVYTILGVKPHRCNYVEGYIVLNKEKRNESLGN